MTTAQVLTLVIAVYAASVSTFVGVTSWRRDHRKRLRISTGMFFIEYASELPGGEVHGDPILHGITITGVNVGHRPITLRSLAFIHRDGTRHRPAPFPAPGASVELPTRDSETAPS